MIERTLAQIYRQIEQGQRVQEIEYDENGVWFVAGEQHTTYVWLAFRVDLVDEETGDGDEDDLDVYRVIRLDPDRVESFGVSRRTGQFERQKNFRGCRYMLGDVRVPPVSGRLQWGYALKRIQEAFHTVQHHPASSGRVNDAGGLQRIYREEIAPAVNVQP